MAEQKLKLVKSGKKQTVHNRKQLRLSNTQSSISTFGQSPISTFGQSPISNLQPPPLTPAEQAEAARFRTFTKQRAARQARVQRLAAHLRRFDDQTANVA